MGTLTIAQHPSAGQGASRTVGRSPLDEAGQVMVKQLKNRYADPAINKKFVLGIDRTKMRLFDTETSAQEDIIDDSRGGKTKRSDAVMDNSKFGMEDRERSKPKAKFGNFKF